MQKTTLQQLPVIGYVVVTYGPRPGRDISKCRAAHRQVRKLQNCAIRLGREINIIHDYCRQVTCLNDLPKFKSILEGRRRAGSGMFFVDSIALLLQRPHSTLRTSFLRELQEFGQHIFGVAECKRLDEIDEYLVVGLLSHDLSNLEISRGPRDRDPVEHQKSAKDASRVASVRRKGQSRANAKRLHSIKAERLAAGQPARLQDIADDANSRGLRNQSGAEWKCASVSRALSVLED